MQRPDNSPRSYNNPSFNRMQRPGNSPRFYNNPSFTSPRQMALHQKPKIKRHIYTKRREKVFFFVCSIYPCPSCPARHRLLAAAAVRHGGSTGRQTTACNSGNRRPARADKATTSPGTVCCSSPANHLRLVRTQSNGAIIIKQSTKNSPPLQFHPTRNTFDSNRTTKQH